MDINLEDFDEIPPSISMIESIRSFGYNFNTAVSDIIDNSITANSTKINIHLEWNKGNPYVLILDNGDGMTDEMLAKNVVLGSKNPTEIRDKNDLGRFGLGLKTASFSMARELHIFSKTKDESICYRSWNLDVIEAQKKWLISKKQPSWYDELFEDIKIKTKGTLIVWKTCDRLLKNASNLKSFLELGKDLIAYLGTIFSRFISSSKTLQIFVNNTKIVPWDPIPEGSTSLGDQYVQNIKITPFVAPHQSNFKNNDDYRIAGGINGWNAQQGFYVYRNKRLIVNGGWLGIKRMKSEEHVKLARIIVDIDTSFDDKWQIDVLKSRASIPSGEIKVLLEAIAKNTRKRADSVYRHRGKIISREEASPEIFVWQIKKEIDQSKSFVINRKHPYVKLIRENYSGRKTDVDRLLTLIEDMLPTETIQIEKGKGTIKLFDMDYDTIQKLFKDALLTTESIGKSREKAVEDLTFYEPFSSFKEQLRKEFL